MLLAGRDPDWIPVRHLREGTWNLFDGEISPNDLLQGSIGNCWLVAAMASLAEFPDAVEKLFDQKELSKTGRCQVRLYDARKGMIELPIDEFIPCHPREWWDDEGMPVFAKPNGNEAWVLLLEKAFAKMLGSYQELSGGNCCTAFRAFTGQKDVFVWARGEGEMARLEGAWKKMQLAPGETHFVWTPGMEERCDSEQLWNRIRMYDQQSYLIACSMRAHHRQEYIREDGLVEAHAYSLLHVVEINKQRMLFLRNPWGNDRRWNGRWCDGDDAWEEHPSLQCRLRPEFQNDGAFWMAWVDFQACFDFVYVCAQTMRSPEATLEHARQSTDGKVPVQRLQKTRRRLVEALPERLPILPVGMRVELMGDVHPTEISGRIMEVIEWDADQQEYKLRDNPAPYWECPKCGEVNKRTREVCNVCAGGRDDLVPHANKPRVYRVRSDCVVLPPGTEVEVAGLEDFPELNGQPGTIRSYDRRAGRYHVELPDGGIRAIRPPHIVARSKTKKEAGFFRWTPPAPEPSHVDEPEPPTDTPCNSDDELRQLLDSLDDRLRLVRDVKPADGRWKAKRGQQLLREGKLQGLSIGQIRRRSGLQVPMRLRFMKRNPEFIRFGAAGAYVDAILQADATLIEHLKQIELRKRLAKGLFSYLQMASPGWVGPSADPPKSKPKPAGGWAGWICQECGHVNSGGRETCESCDPEGDGC